MEDSTHPLGDGQDKWTEELLGRGAGDADVFGSPGSPRLKATPGGSVIDLGGGWYTLPMSLETSGVTSDGSRPEPWA